MVPQKKNTIIGLVELMEIIQALRMEFNKEIEPLKKTQTEMKVKLNNPLTQLKNLKGSLTRIKQQIEHKDASTK